jgi:hypothetical protein
MLTEGETTMTTTGHGAADAELEAQLLTLVLSLADEMAADLDEPVDVAAGADAPLFGAGAPLSSIALVALVAGLEQEIDDRFGAMVELADDRAVSQSRSPFRTAGALASWAATLVREAS